jgi:hypothetical protein
MARESLAAGIELNASRKPRSAANRLYYSAYQASHAILLSTPYRSNIPSRGNWDHGAVVGGITGALVRYAWFSRPAADQFRLKLMASFWARTEADYKPGTVIDARTISEARSAAVGLTRVAQRMIPS